MYMYMYQHIRFLQFKNSRCSKIINIERAKHDGIYNLHFCRIKAGNFLLQLTNSNQARSVCGLQCFHAISGEASQFNAAMLIFLC